MFRLWPARRALPGVLLVLSSLLAGALVPPTALAGDPLPIPHGPLPIDELKPVELSFLTVDATISAEGDGIALEARTRTRLRNPEKRASFERQVTFPGLPVYDVKVGTQNGGVQPAGGPGPWHLTLGPDGDAIIEGTQRLSAGGPLVDLQLDWGALQAWGSSPGAARLTLHFLGDLASEQLLIVDPAPTRRDTVRLSWSYENLRPAGRVRVLFVAPASWRALHAARQAASGSQAGVADYLALAGALRPLVEAEGMPPDLAGTLQAERLWALRRAVAVGPPDAQAHQELAIHLQAQAAGSAALLAEAVSEFKAACDLAPTDAGLKTRLLSALDELIAACRQAGDGRGVLAALDVAQAVDPHSQEMRAAGYAGLVVDLLEAGRGGEAEVVIVAGFGQAALDRYAFYRPHFSSITGEVETHIGLRTLRFVLVPAPGMDEAAGRDVAALVEAMGRPGSSQIQHTASGGRIHLVVSIPFASPQELRAAGQALTAGLPAETDPALLLVAAVANPPNVDFSAAQGLRADHLAYAEAASLAPAHDALSRRLEQLRSARAEAEAQTDSPVEAARRRWALALLGEYEAGWQALASGSRVTYRLLPPEDLVAPQWALAWGEQRSLSWSTSIPRLERLWPYLLGAAGALLALLVGLLAWQHRR